MGHYFIYPMHERKLIKISRWRLQYPSPESNFIFLTFSLKQVHCYYRTNVDRTMQSITRTPAATSFGTELRAAGLFHKTACLDVMLTVLTTKNQSNTSCGFIQTLKMLWNVLTSPIIRVRVSLFKKQKQTNKQKTFTHHHLVDQLEKMISESPPCCMLAVTSITNKILINPCLKIAVYKPTFCRAISISSQLFRIETDDQFVNKFLFLSSDKIICQRKTVWMLTHALNHLELFVIFQAKRSGSG